MGKTKCKICGRMNCRSCCKKCNQRARHCECCKTCEETKNDCKCIVPEVQALVRTSQPPTISTMSNVEPPDMNVLQKEGSAQLGFYISGLKRWARASGVDKTLQEDTVLTYAFTQAPDLCRDLLDDLNSSTGDENAGIDRIIAKLQEKFGVNKHVDMVKILNSFLNTTRTKGENLVDYITRFEGNYAEEKIWERPFRQRAWQSFS